MANDVLPSVYGDGGYQEAAPVIMVDGSGSVYSSAMRSEALPQNSTNTPLGSESEFAGEWVADSYEHAAVNVLADQQGTLYIEFGILKDGVDPTGLISDSDVTVTFSAPRTIYANRSYFRPVVKMAGRAMRVRYVNDSVAQGSMALLTSVGVNMFPASTSDDNELIVTNADRQYNDYVAYSESGVSSSGYALLIDLSDTVNFPHENTGALAMSSTYFQVDREQNSTGSVVIGVITRIDGTDADVTYFQGVTFNKSSERSIVRDRNFSPSQIKLGVIGGEAIHIATTGIATGITAINTGITLPTPVGTATPAVGDIVVSWSQAAANFDFSVSGFYRSTVSPEA